MLTSAACSRRCLLDQEAGLDRGVIAADGARDDLELEIVAHRDDARRYFEGRYIRRQFQRELHAFALNEELVLRNLDRPAFPNRGMREGDRSQSMTIGAAALTTGRFGAVQWAAAGTPATVMFPTGAVINWLSCTSASMNSPFAVSATILYSPSGKR